MSDENNQIKSESDNKQNHPKQEDNEKKDDHYAKYKVNNIYMINRI